MYMKKLMLTLLIATMAFNAHAQFTKATLQATGLTCAMCSNAINKALQKVNFIESVKSDIKNSSFSIAFKQNSNMDIDAIKKAVEDAGFSVGSLKLTGSFNEIKIANDQHVQIGANEFCFLNVNNQTLNGEATITVVGKSYMTLKEYKKISSSSKMECLQTGKASPCCGLDGASGSTKIYHVTI
jgi:copper chaperone CopZ